MIGFDGGASESIYEQAGDGESLVANVFGGESKAWPAGEEEVFGIEFLECGRGGGALLIGAGGHDEFDEGLEIPAGFDEAEGEPVEEFGVGGVVALGAEVGLAGDDSFSEEESPDVVDGDACGEGVVRLNEPAGEVEAVGGLIRVCGFEGREEGGGSGVDEVFGGGVNASFEKAGFPGLGGGVHDHDRMFFCEDVQPVLEVGEVVSGVSFGWADFLKMGADGVVLFCGSLGGRDFDEVDEMLRMLAVGVVSGEEFDSEFGG